MRIAVGLALLAGCDFTFDLDHIDGHADAAVDAFDPATDCRSDYTLELWPGSRFRIYGSSDTAWNTSDACTYDEPLGTSHLAVAQTREKLDALIGALTVRQGGMWWIGGVQPTSATTPADKWLWVTGEPIDPALWNANEPNDDEGTETDHFDQFALISQTGTGLIDASGSLALGALCECDGHMVATAAKVAIDQSRP